MDSLIQSILDGKMNCTEDEIEFLTASFQERFVRMPNIVDIPSQKLFFIGDLHGELTSVLAIQKYIERYEDHYFVFLGDYVDRGPEQIETFNLVIALTLAYPERILMLRGNHESEEVVHRYGFYDTVRARYSIDIFRCYIGVFESLPIAAYHRGALFACHGGVPEGAKSTEDIQLRNRRDPNFPDDVLFQIVWNDPQEGDFKFRPNMRGGRSKYFGQAAFDTFTKDIAVSHLFRAHEVIPEGYLTLFQNRLVSIFSASYGGQVEPKIVRVGTNGKMQILSLF